MKEFLAFAGVAAIALSLWLLLSREETVVNAKNAQITALQDTLHAKDSLLAQNDDLVSSKNEMIKNLQDKIQTTEDALAKDQTQIESDKAEIQKIQNADQTIIASLKSDNQADIQALKEDIQTKDEQIAQLNEKLVQMIAYYEGKLKTAKIAAAPAPDDTEKIYPKDNGFELQNVGTGFFSYRYFGDSIRNPTNIELPPNEPNQTPWVFTKDAGVAANGSGFYVANATNGNSDGKTSELGQAAFIQFKDSAVSQMIDLPTGTFSVTFSYEARRNYTSNEIAVSLDGTVLFKGAPQDVANFTEVTTDPLPLSAGKHELKFLGLGDGAGGDFPCTFIDNVSINVVGSHRHSDRKSGLKTTNVDSGAESPHLVGVAPGNDPIIFQPSVKAPVPQ